jgi:hypothetical protein
MREHISELTRFQRGFASALAGARLVTEPGLARAISVHRNTSTKAAQDALAANFPIVRSLFGHQPFAVCTAGYVAIAPPSDPRLNAYGKQFPAFLRAYAPAIPVPYVAEVAAVERLYTEALFAADEEPLGGARFGAWMHPELKLRLHPATRFAEFQCPAVSIWLAHHHSPLSLGTIRWRAEAALVTRPGLQCQVSILSSGGFEFLRACADGSPLGEAVMVASEAGADLQAMFMSLVAAGAFAAGSHGDKK